MPGFILFFGVAGFKLLKIIHELAVLETAILAFYQPPPPSLGEEGGRLGGELPNKKHRIGHHTFQELKNGFGTS